MACHIFYLKGKFEKLEITLGNYYGTIWFGLYINALTKNVAQEQTILIGARVVYKPYKGIVLKAVTGEQRRYWAHNDSWINGADLELNLGEWFAGLQKSDYKNYVRWFVRK